MKIKYHLILADGGRGMQEAREPHIADEAEGGVDGRLRETKMQGDKN